MNKRKLIELMIGFLLISVCIAMPGVAAVSIGTEIASSLGWGTDTYGAIFMRLILAIPCVGMGLTLMFIFLNSKQTLIAD